jgi:hypothetical protein
MSCLLVGRAHALEGGSQAHARRRAQKLFGRMSRRMIESKAHNLMKARKKKDPQNLSPSHKTQNHGLVAFGFVLFVDMLL